MTDYKIAEMSIEEMKGICSELINSKEEEIFNKLSLYNELDNKLKKIQPIITRIKLRRNETCEEKKIYGEKMIKNVDILLERYEIIYNIFEEELSVFKENYEIEKKKQIEQKLLQEKQKKKDEEELLNKGRIKTKEEEEEIQKRNEEKLKNIKKEKEQYENKINTIETIKSLIKEKSNFFYDQIVSACNKQDAIKYIYTQLGESQENIQNHINNISEENDEVNVYFTNPIHLLDCIYLIYKNNKFKPFKEAMKNIIEYLEELVKNIGDEKLKLINLMNKTFQNNILSKSGTIFIFIIIGYVLKKSEDIEYVLKKLNREINNENIYIYLEEPDITINYDKWEKWFNNMHASLDILCTFYRHLNKYSDVPDDEKVKSIFLYLKEKFSANQRSDIA
ncbi:conserved Plasmodium protein, unknown function [Plasmodium berghei]|uniref:PUB domain-containing protein, putative n=2 Tax=Plasmodium berghei TaxID=5821 RepID=A0A509AQH8_PLABA|nr:PUB domain-containing protein, putative [Plasmodium berghei ANKA]CXI99820.1 conserved Plasmodium protein, unknown function [Plasmodium berghei]SCL97915.1 conserved Plasmodium protein, unknown function [Plasmodium berghei]SCM16712.1 conserved Plasmodium protein, unknown function [Plasmodium berghei]SCM18510.1 conserved Plasmodium protein, unknown function [Plasmodium berghei]SCN27943.1 conserved Plasmodium protein, unknown function [Plasmodium berghei]|eukprot:XP_034423596.1 PUB domain-containing protein, putative [Plasmodium berghei ANKA]